MAMGEKLSPSEGRGYLIIKRIQGANYNNWKLASDYGILSCVCVNVDFTGLESTATNDNPLLPVVLFDPMLEAHGCHAVVRMRRLDLEICDFDPDGLQG
jgi:hypothetical protein